MQVNITYSYDPQASSNYPCWAKSVVHGRALCTCAENWDAVRKEHLERISQVATTPEPPCEETVEI